MDESPKTMGEACILLARVEIRPDFKQIFSFDRVAAAAKCTRDDAKDNMIRARQIVNRGNRGQWQPMQYPPFSHPSLSSQMNNNKAMKKALTLAFAGVDRRAPFSRKGPGGIGWESSLSRPSIRHAPTVIPPASTNSSQSAALGVSTNPQPSYVANEPTMKELKQQYGYNLGRPTKEWKQRKMQKGKDDALIKAYSTARDVIESRHANSANPVAEARLVLDTTELFEQWVEDEKRFRTESVAVRAARKCIKRLNQSKQDQQEAIDTWNADRAAGRPQVARYDDGEDAINDMQLSDSESMSESEHRPGDLRDSHLAGITNPMHPPVGGNITTEFMEQLMGSDDRGSTGGQQHHQPQSLKRGASDENEQPGLKRLKRSPSFDGTNFVAKHEPDIKM